ncbi:preprotein translocase subunit YajC [Chloroflexota bacterium]
MKKNLKRKLGLLAGLLVTTVTVGGCVPPETADGGFDWTIIVFLVLIFAVFYFLMIRPQRKRQKEHQQMAQELQSGDKVITIGGIYGKIKGVSEDSVVLEVESGTTLKMSKSSIAGKQQNP